MPRAKKPITGDIRAALDIPGVEEAIKSRLPTLIQRMFDLAEGVIMVETRTDKDSGELVQRVYQCAPDRQALQFLIENVIGKTPQRIEMTGKDGEAMQIIPWMPLAAMTAKQLPVGDTVVDGVYEVLKGESDG